MAQDVRLWLDPETNLLEAQFSGELRYVGTAAHNAIALGQSGAKGTHSLVFTIQTLLKLFVLERVQAELYLKTIKAS